MARRKRRGRSDHSRAAPTKSAVHETAESDRAAGEPSISPTKKWLRRGILAILGPVFFFAVCEAALRLGGFGVPTQFLLSETVNGRDCWVANPHFGDRFFGANLARQPSVFAIPRAKGADTVRVFVFGGSAALGDPQPDFGISRMLRTLLTARFPQTEFEVVNTAMIGINSHVVREIADGCTEADGDIWVVYLGNNEVVGPFGAGTVFGPQVPHAATIRSSLAVKSTRFGQLLERLTLAVNPPPASKQRWRGMLMFLENQVRDDDPRMTRTYEFFADNLRHLLDAADAAQAGVVLSTVAVNLRDCAPFASLHQPGLTDEQLDQWQTAFDQGVTAQEQGDHAAALVLFQQAAAIDSTYADLSFATAQSLAAIGRHAEAAQMYREARDQDALRFRCDSRLNDVIREVAANHAGERLRLADAEQVFAEAASEGRSPGRQHFYEHVHLSFEGNYLLARTIADQIIPLLPDKVRTAADTGWLTADECGKHLGWNAWAQANALNDILARVADAPFTNQINHQSQLANVQREVAALSPRVAEAAQQADELYKTALSANPDDSYLYAQRCHLHILAKNMKAAIADAERAVELLPICLDHWLLLGATQASAGEFDKAADAFNRALRLDEQSANALLSLARVERSRDNRQAAIATFRRTIEANPHYGTAYLELGQMLEQDGQLSAAIENYRLAQENRVLRALDLMQLAAVCVKQNWATEAAANCLDAVALEPVDPAVRIQAGQMLLAVRKYEQAQRQFHAAVELTPDSGEAHFLYAQALGLNQELDEAITQFREAARLLPGVAAPRINLAVTLKAAGRRDEAIQALRDALQIEPTNEVALKHLDELEQSDSE